MSQKHHQAEDKHEDAEIERQIVVVPQKLQELPKVKRGTGMLQLVPLEDFKNSNALRDEMRKHASNVQHRTIPGQIVLGTTGHGNLDVAELTVTTYQIRAEDLRKMIGDDLLVMVLKSFEFNTGAVRLHVQEPQPEFSDLRRRMMGQIMDIAPPPVQLPPTLSDFPELLLSLLSGVHASDNERLHSICMGDTARKSVNFFSRSPLNDKTYWQTNSKDMSIKKLQAHVRELYKFIVEAVTASLKQAVISFTGEHVWILRANEKVYALSLNTDDATSELDDSDDGFPTAIQMRIMELEEDDIIDADGAHPDICYLQQKIEEKKRQLLERLSIVELDTKSCATFLTESYPICINTLKTMRNS